MNNINFLGEDCKKKWGILRDGLNRSLSKKSTGKSAAEIAPIDSSLAFLLNTSIVKRSTTSNVPPVVEAEDTVDTPPPITDTEITENAFSPNYEYNDDTRLDDISNLDYNPMSPTCSVSLPSTSTSINRPQSSSSASQFFSNFSGAEELSGTVEENRKKNRRSRTN